MSAGIGGLGSLLVLGAGALSVFLAVKNPFDLSVLALVPGLFAIFAMETLGTGASTKRTPTGRDLWSRIGGFRRAAQARRCFNHRQPLDPLRFRQRRKRNEVHDDAGGKPHREQQAKQDAKPAMNQGQHAHGPLDITT